MSKSDLRPAGPLFQQHSRDPWFTAVRSSNGRNGRLDGVHPAPPNTGKSAEWTLAFL